MGIRFSAGASEPGRPLTIFRKIAAGTNAGLAILCPACRLAKPANRPTCPAKPTWRPWWRRQLRLPALRRSNAAPRHHDVTSRCRLTSLRRPLGHGAAAGGEAVVQAPGGRYDRAAGAVAPNPFAAFLVRAERFLPYLQAVPFLPARGFSCGINKLSRQATTCVPSPASPPLGG
jgi:hypothetical protein